MSITNTFKQKVKKYMSEADQRAEKRLGNARTAAERDKIRAQLRKEKLAIKKEVAEAETALLKAETARKQAKKELKDIGRSKSKGGSFFSSFTNYANKSTGKKKSGKKKKTDWRKMLIG